MVKNNKSNEPVVKITIGSVTGSVFLNVDEETDNKWYSTTIQKFYNAGSKKKAEWEYTNSYNAVDLHHLSLVAQDCERWILENKIPREE